MDPPRDGATPRADAGGGDAAPDLAGVDVLHVISGDAWGGAPRVVDLLATRTATTDAVACGPIPRLVDRLEGSDVRVFRRPRLRSPPSPASDARELAGLAALLSRESFDLVHCHSTKAGALGRVAARVAGVPSVFTVHGWGFYNTGYDRLGPAILRAERLLARATGAVVCVSESDRERGTSEGILGHTDARVVHNGIPPVELSGDRARLPETGVDADRPVIGTVGRLVEQKRPTELFRAGEALRDRGVDVSVVWIGDGPLADRCRSRADGTDSHLLGFREDALELAADFDVFVLPSAFEGFPLVVLEAMHLGLPVVACDVGGVGEAVLDGETGFLVDPDDHTALVDRIEPLLREPSVADRMGRRGRERATGEFSVDRMVAGYEGVYRDVLAGTP